MWDRMCTVTGQSVKNYVQVLQTALDGRRPMLGWRPISERVVPYSVLQEWSNATVDLGFT